MLEFTGIAIETPLQTWRWDDIQATPIKAVAEPLVSLSYLPEKMVISPAIFHSAVAWCESRLIRP